MFKIGADPELFLLGGKELFSSIGLIGGTKRNPRPIGNQCFVQEDNVAVEFNIPPAEDVNNFLKSIHYSLDTIKEMVSSLGLSLSIVASGSFNQRFLNDPNAQVFGCDPDYNAYSMKRNNPPKAKDATLRSCGGHVHVGGDFSKREKIELVKTMDLMLGVPSVILDNDETRKQLYGAAGAFRDKSYGVEYRVLSNFWIFYDNLIEWVFNQTQKAAEQVKKGSILHKETQETVVSCINNNDKSLANKLIKTFQLTMPA
jgi:hypothetical protein